jgi:flagellar biosynthesis anti-sigma factor FlgM
MHRSQETRLRERRDDIASETTAGRANEAAATVDTDRVEAVPDAPVANTAVHAERDVPALRADKIAAAKKAIADGTLGHDAGAIADALIDHVLDDSK